MKSKNPADVLGTSVRGASWWERNSEKRTDIRTRRTSNVAQSGQQKLRLLLMKRQESNGKWCELNSEERFDIRARRTANVAQSGQKKGPADVVDGTTGERRKMMRAQLRGARRY